MKDVCPKCKKGHLQVVSLAKPEKAIAALSKKVCPRCGFNGEWYVKQQSQKGR